MRATRAADPGRAGAGEVAAETADTTCSSGLLGEDDSATDLGTLEKKLAEKRLPQNTSQTAASNPTSPSLAAAGHEVNDSTPHSSLASSESFKDGRDGEKRKSLTPEGKSEEEEVEALSEMMCSLVTNNYGETRYIGGFSPLPARLGYTMRVADALLRLILGLFHLLAQGDPMGE